MCCRIEQQDGGALGGEAIFVQIGGEAGHTGNGEVEFGNGIADLPQEGGKKPTETSIDMEPKIVLERELAEIADGIENAVRIARSGTDQHDRLVIDSGAHRGHIGAKPRGHRDTAYAEAEIVSRLVDGGVAGLRDYKIRVRQGRSLGARPIACGFQREEQAFRPAGGEASAGRRPSAE